MAMHILNQMIKKEALLELTKNYEKFTAVLTEPKDKDSRVEIRGVPENTIVIKLDSFPDTRSLFNGSRGECKRADYIIISDYNGKKRILFIEMKKTKAQEKDLVKQLKGAACVISYCKEVAKHFFECKDFLSEFEYRFISFKKTSIRKTGLRHTDRKCPKHDSPEKMLKISYPNHIQYNHLAGA